PTPASTRHTLPSVFTPLPPPPTSPLFPYTTLFRSYLLRPPQAGDMGWVIQRHGALYAQEYGWNEEFEALVAEIVARFVRRFDAKDRKSTRLNSSHDQISYAVFCLKKKRHITSKDYL